MWQKRDWNAFTIKCTYHTLFLFAIGLNLQWINWVRRKTLLLSNELWQEITFGHSRISRWRKLNIIVKCAAFVAIQSIGIVSFYLFLINWHFSVAINRTVYCFIGLFDFVINIIPMVNNETRNEIKANMFMIHEWTNKSGSCTRKLLENRFWWANSIGI